MTKATETADLPSLPCRTCGEPSDWIEVSYRAMAEYREASLAWKARYSGPTIADRLVDVTDLADWPQPAPWLSSCDEHVLDDGTYGFRYPRTWQAWTHVTAHLLESKGWLLDTNWHGVLYAVEALTR